MLETQDTAATSRRMQRPAKAVCSVVVLLVFGATCSSPEAAKMLADCSDCTHFAPTVVIDGRDTPELQASLNAVVARDQRGRILVSPGTTEIPIVFDSGGEYIGLLARKGRGPGELITSSWIDAGRDDSVRVFSANRVIVFDGMLKYARSYVWQLDPFGLPAQVEFLQDGRLAVKTRTPEGPLSPIVIRIVDPNGSVSSVIDISRVVEGVYNPRIAAAHEGAHLWGLRQSSRGKPGYEVLRLQQDGRYTVVAERIPPWWAERTDRGFQTDVSRAVDIRELPGQLIAVVIAQPRSRPIQRDRPFQVHGPYVTVVEVVNIAERRVVGRFIMAGEPLRMVGDRHVATYFEVDDYPMLSIARIDYALP